MRGHTPPLPLAICVEVAQYEHWEPLSHNAAHQFPQNKDAEPSPSTWPIPFAQAGRQDDCCGLCHERPVFTSPHSGYLGLQFAAKIERGA